MMSLVGLVAALVVPLNDNVRRANRADHLRCGAFQSGEVATYLVDRFGCTEQQADKAERKLLPNLANSLRAPRMEAVCVALQLRLGLSEKPLNAKALRAAGGRWTAQRSPRRVSASAHMLALKP